MKFTYSLIIMFIIAFLINFFLTNTIMVKNINKVTHNLSNIYISIIMASCVILLDIAHHDYQYKVFSTNLYILVLGMIIFFIYLYRNQVGINDKEYLKAMIEHHSMALLTSEEILKKTDDYNVAKLAKNIIQNQNDEINEMEDLLDKN